ncbi:MAG: DUF308 domain-containing protein [Bacteroidota bacterium]
MNKTNFLILSGISMILAGVVMLYSKNIGITASKILLPLLFLLGGITTFQFAIANKQNKTANTFHKIQGVLFIVFSMLVIFVPDSLKSFMLYLTYFCLCYGLIEIMFSFATLSSKVTIRKNMVMYRLISGFINAIGAIVLLLTVLSDEFLGLQTAGFLTAIGGISCVLFTRKVNALSSAV